MQYVASIFITLSFDSSVWHKVQVDFCYVTVTSPIEELRR